MDTWDYLNQDSTEVGFVLPVTGELLDIRDCWNQDNRKEDHWLVVMAVHGYRTLIPPIQGHKPLGQLVWLGVQRFQSDT